MPSKLAAVLVAAVVAAHLSTTSATAAPVQVVARAVCGNADLLTGPAAPPENAITVPAGDNAGFDFNRPGRTFWFAPGTHMLADDIYGQIQAKPGTTYLGAPGSVIDGRNKNLYAFTGDVADVTIKYLTIKNFGRGLDNRDEGVVNHDAGAGWTVQFNTITANDGAAVFLGSGNVVADNCLSHNGQYGFSMFRPPIEGDSSIKNITLTGNEITGNNTDDWESHVDGCGCTGGGKFWDVLGARVTNNWVHDNRGTGLWADTNNIDFLFQGNTIERNDGEGIWYEISYNATIRDNVFRRNAWVSGRKNTGSPGPAIYLSESGGEPQLPSTISGAAAIRITGNTFEDNFSGVSIYENTNRFCNSNGNTSKGYCTPLVRPTLLPEDGRNYEYPNPIHPGHPCYTDIATEPFRTDCRWHAKNVEVTGNVFRFDESVVPCAGRFCGAQALYADGADNIPWSPYTVAGIQQDVMFGNGNTFHHNQYVGNWKFAKGYGEVTDFSAWRAAPFNQDAGSTIEGEQNVLDRDTAGLEGSIGQWGSWYGATVAADSTQAHTGARSLKVSITAADWAIETTNWPGFGTGPGPKTLSFWTRLGTGTAIQPTLEVTWLNATNQPLGTSTLTAPALTTTWQHATTNATAPPGTTTARITLHGDGTTGNHLYLDDFRLG